MADEKLEIRLKARFAKSTAEKPFVTEFQRLGSRSSFQREAGRKMGLETFTAKSALIGSRSSFQREAGRKAANCCRSRRCSASRSSCQREAGRKRNGQQQQSDANTALVAIAFPARGGSKVKPRWIELVYDDRRDCLFSRRRIESCRSLYTACSDACCDRLSNKG